MALQRFAWLLPLLCAALVVRAQRRVPPGGASRSKPARMPDIADQALLGVAQLDLEGRLLLVNDALCRMLGVDRAWMQGRPMPTLAHPDDVPGTLQRFAELVRTGRPFVSEQRVMRPDGGQIWAEGHLSLLRDAAARPYAVVAVLQDVTARRGTLAALEARVAVATAERNRAREGLCESRQRETLGRLADGVAHDFNNVLQAIAGGARLIERHAGNPGIVKRLTGLVVDAVEYGASVTRGLHAFARSGDLAPGPVEVAPLLDGLRDMLRQRLGAGVVVQVEAPLVPLAVLVDRGQLEAVLVNLAANARDAIVLSVARTGLSYGILTLRAEAERVGAGAPHRAGLPPGDYVRIAAVDTGWGMEEGALERATEPFFTTKPRGRGTGLGLAIALGFAEQSGGRLAIESVPGQGTTVTLWLPQAPPGAAVSAR